MMGVGRTEEGGKQRPQKVVGPAPARLLVLNRPITMITLYHLMPISSRPPVIIMTADSCDS